MELNVQNNTDTSIVVTTKDFVVKDLTTGKALPQDKIHEIFPPNDITGDYIDFVRLKGKPSEEIQPKSIQLQCEFDIGTAKEDGAYNAVSTCSYGNTIDEALQESKLQQLKQKWKDEGKKNDEIEFETINWKLLEGKRLFKPDSFDFIIQSIGIYTNPEILLISCKIMLDKLKTLETIIDNDKINIKVSDNTMLNCYDIILDNEDYTIGKVIEYYLLAHFYEKGLLTFCGFKMLHPHDSFSKITVAYKEPVEISTIKDNLKKCILFADITFNKIKKEFMKLVPR
jgi:DNA-directed RNA polymerase subunit L